MDIILASGSPRRKELLSAMGVRDFQIVIPDFDERSVGPFPPADLVRRLAVGKGRAAAAIVGEDTLVIAADTVVALDDEVLGKPRSEEEAKDMLRRLSGRTHRVFTGVTAMRQGRESTHYVCTEVTFRALTEEEISNYVRTGEPMDKAGAYGIQGVGAQLVSSISGDYFNVMGLPVCTLAEMLRHFGVDTLALAAERGADA